MSDFASILTGEEFSAFLGGMETPHDKRLAASMLRDEAMRWWLTRAPFRAERAEARNNYRGRQWERPIQREDGSWTTEEQFIKERGQVPIVMNLVAPVVNNIQGQLLQNSSDRLAYAVEEQDDEAVQQMNLARRAVRRYNESNVIEADSFKEMILSGATAFKSSYRWDHNLERYEVVDHTVDQSRFFYNLDISDRRFKGLRIIGEIHDVHVHDLVSLFARSKRDAERILSYYPGKTADHFSGLTDYGFTTFDREDFFSPRDPSLCRVIEVWKPVYKWVRYGLDPLRELIPDGYGALMLPENEVAKAQNIRRQMNLPLLELDEPRYVPIWHYWFLTPNADVLQEGVTPYEHGEHPYTPGIAMLVDGETWGVVSNIISPQRWLNRTLGQVDHMLGSASKGTPHVDAAVLRESNLTLAEYMRLYNTVGEGVALELPAGKRLSDIVYNHMPNSIQPGLLEIVPMLVNFVERTSGVSEANQGLTPKSGTPASLYQQQVLQGSVNVLLYLQSYFQTLRQKDRKEIKLIVQAFAEPRRFSTEAPGQEPVVFDPDRVAKLDWDVAMGDAPDTTTLRRLWDTLMREDVQSGYLPYEVYLQESSFPLAKRLLQRLQEQMRSPVAEAAGEPDMAALLQLVSQQ